MVKGNGEYISIDYEKVVDVFLTEYQNALITRDVLRSMLFDEDYVATEAIEKDLADRQPKITVAELQLAMLQFPLKQFRGNVGDIDAVASLYTAKNLEDLKNTKLSDTSEMGRFKKLSGDNSSIALIIAVSEWLNDSDNTLTKYGNIEDWDVSNVSTMKNLFKDAASFNENLSKWDVSNVTDMTDMFSGATAMNGRTPSLPDTPDPAKWSDYWA